MCITHESGNAIIFQKAHSNFTHFYSSTRLALYDAIIQFCPLVLLSKSFSRLTDRVCCLPKFNFFNDDELKDRRDEVSYHLSKLQFINRSINQSTSQSISLFSFVFINTSIPVCDLQWGDLKYYTIEPRAVTRTVGGTSTRTAPGEVVVVIL